MGLARTSAAFSCSQVPQTRLKGKQATMCALKVYRKQASYHHKMYVVVRVSGEQATAEAQPSRVPASYSQMHEVHLSQALGWT